MLTAPLLALLLAASAPVHAPSPDARTGEHVAGHWEGAFSRVGSVQRVEVDLALRGGALTGTYRIAELGLADEPLTEVAVTDSSVAFRLMYGRFEMRVGPGAAELTGTNTRWNPAVTLHLKRASRELPYDREAVRVPVRGAVIAGTLYMPRQRERAPLVVVAGGSEHTTRRSWESRSWGDVLARQGIAAFVYDRRGYGESTGDSAQADLRVEAADVAAMTHRLARDPRVDRRRVGVMGSSRGGWVAALAAGSSRQITMLMLECAPAVGVVEQELQRIANVEPTDSITAADVAAAVAYERRWLRAALDGASWRTIDSLSVPARVSRWRSIAAIPASPEDVAWWVRNDLDQQAVLRRVRVPVLALLGAEDRTVPASENLAPLREALAAGTGGRATVTVVPQAGHGLWTFGTLLGGEWRWPVGHWRWARKAPGVFEGVGEWIRAQDPSVVPPR